MVDKNDQDEQRGTQKSSPWYKMTLWEFVIVLTMVIVITAFFMWLFHRGLPPPRAYVRGNMKDIELAILNYEISYMRFPDTAIRDEEGNALLSWRVQLLPFLKHEELYNEFHLDEPWDSEHNKKLISRMPSVYENLFARQKVKGFKTNLLFPVSVGVPENQSTMFSDGNGRTRQEIEDGISETIMLVVAEDDRNVLWTKPGDLPFNPEDPANGLKILDNGNFMVMTVEGRVTYPSPETSREKLLSQFTCSGEDQLEEESEND